MSPLSMALAPLLFIFAAGLGAYLRLQSVQFLVHPWGTLLVNFLGSLLIGILAVYLAKSSPQAKNIVLVAFLGSLTTFSSYSIEVVTFLEEGLYLRALSHFLITNSLCIFGCFVGWKWAQSFH